MMRNIKRTAGDEGEKRKKKKKSSVFLLFCVSVGSFCDQLTVVFCSFVCLFSTNSNAFKGVGREVLGSLSFSLFTWNGCALGIKSLVFMAGRKEQFARLGKEKI